MAGSDDNEALNMPRFTRMDTAYNTLELINFIIPDSVAGTNPLKRPLPNLSVSMRSRYNRLDEHFISAKTLPQNSR